MAESLQSEDKTLHDIFQDGWKLFEELETTSLPFAGHEYQSKVKESMETFEKSTNVVNKISMFSPNELIDEVPTEHLQYLLLPFFLAKLSTKSNDPDRLRILELAEIYYNDFIQRCADYELTEAPKKNENSTAVERSGAPENELASLINAAHSRNNKIAQFRKKKDLDEEIKLLRVAVFNETVDDEIKRNFFLKFINRSILESKEELESIQLEKQMVQMRASHAKSTAEPHKHNRIQAPARPPMKPFIITRDNTQKAVFGLGYPSLPVMTVDEFYHQRVHEGIFPDQEQIEKMNQQQRLAQLALTNPDEKEEEEKAANEILVENDDPEYLQRQRGMDEYKDVVRRGDGNRHNRS